MSTTHDLIIALKKELKAAQMTYAQLGKLLGMAESSVKRMFSKEDMPLSRVDEICKALQIDFADIAQRIADERPALSQLTLEQEKIVTSDKKLLLVAICVLSQWSLEQITKHYHISETECIRCLAQLDRLGIIELKPHNHYRLKLGKAFRWQPNGPVMNFFREHALLDYFSGNFAMEDEVLTLVYGNIAPANAHAFIERIQKLAQEFSRQHQIDHKLSLQERKGYSLVMGMRRWEFELLENQRRPK